MTTSIADLLKNRSADEPPEIQTIKQFVKTEFNTSCQVSLQSNQIIITIQSASLAGALRMKLHELQRDVGPDKRLVIRIS